MDEVVNNISRRYRRDPNAKRPEKPQSASTSTKSDAEKDAIIADLRKKLAAITAEKPSKKTPAPSNPPGTITIKLKPELADRITKMRAWDKKVAAVLEKSFGPKP